MSPKTLLFSTQTVNLRIMFMSTEGLIRYYQILASISKSIVVKVVESDQFSIIFLILSIYSDLTFSDSEILETASYSSLPIYSISFFLSSSYACCFFLHSYNLFLYASYFQPPFFILSIFRLLIESISIFASFYSVSNSIFQGISFGFSIFSFCCVSIGQFF